jgi:hypothetical protein
MHLIKLHLIYPYPLHPSSPFRQIDMSHPYVKVATSLQNRHHTSNIKPNSRIAMTEQPYRSECLPDGGVYWLIWKPWTSSIGRYTRYSTTASRWPSKWPSKWVHNTSLFCLLSPWWPPRRYGASSRLMAASSGFQCSPRHAALGDAACIASTPHHGHQNGLQRTGICSLLPPILLGIIIAKDHVMVH